MAAPVIPEEYEGQWIPDRVPGDPPRDPALGPGFQETALNADEFEVFLGGAKGPGKTDIIVLKHFEYVHIEHGLAVLLRASAAEAQLLIDRMFKLTDGFPASMRPAYTGSPRPTFTWPSRHKTEIGYIERLRDVRRYHGREPWYFGYDELGDQPDERVADALIREIRSTDERLPRWFRGSGNPGKPGHGWTKKRYVTPTKYGRRLVRVRTKLPDGSDYSYFRRFIRGFVWDNPIYRHDRQYLAQLMAQTEREQRQQVFGDYDAAGGLAFDELDERVHMVRPFDIPDSWEMWAGHDWGFAHPCWFVVIARSPDGDLYVVHAKKMHRHKDRAQAQAIVADYPRAKDLIIYSGGDAFAGTEAKRDDYTESTADRYAEFGLTLVPANDSKKARRKMLREVLAWRGKGRNGADGEPTLRFFRRGDIVELFEQCQGLVEDEKDPELVAKSDADPSTGKGGDDGYDALGKAICSHIPDSEPETGITTQDALAWLARSRQVVGTHSPYQYEVLS
mgnify:CR=1 FL=1